MSNKFKILLWISSIFFVVNVGESKVKNGYYVRLGDSQDHQYGIMVNKNKIRLEFHSHDSVYVTPYFKIRKIDSDYYTFIDPPEDFMYWEAIEHSHSYDPNLKGDTIMLNIELPDLDCNYFLYVKSFNKKEYYSSFDNGGVATFYFNYTPPPLKYKNEAFSLMDNDALEIFCNFIWKPEQLIQNPDLKDYLMILFFFPLTPDMDYVPNVLNLSLKGVESFFFNFPLNRSNIFQISGDTILIDSEEYILKR